MWRNWFVVLRNFRLDQGNCILLELRRQWVKTMFTLSCIANTIGTCDPPQLKNNQTIKKERKNLIKSRKNIQSIPPPLIVCRTRAMRGLMGCKLRETGPSAGLIFSWNYGLFCILVIIHISWLALLMGCKLGETGPSWSLYIIPWDFNTWGHWDPPLASLPLPWWKTGPKMLFCNKLQRMLAKVRNFGER